MIKIKERLKNYIAKNSVLKISGDIIFYIFILLMIIPYTRREVSSFIIKATLRNPSVKNEEAVTKLSSNDYEMTVSDLEGKTTSLSEFKDEVIIMNFWATWCPPCRAEMPSFQKLYNDYGDEIVFLFISNEEGSVIQNYFDENGYSMPVYTQTSSLPGSFQVSSIPTTYLLSKEGEIIIEKTGAADWNSEKFRTMIDDLISR